MIISEYVSVVADNKTGTKTSLLKFTLRNIAKKAFKKSSPKRPLKGDRPKGVPKPFRPLNVFVVLMFTTAGLTRSARSEKEPGVVSEEETAAAVGISGAPEGKKEDRRTSTKETIKNATKNAIKNMKNVLRFLLSILSSVTLIKNYGYFATLSKINLLDNFI